MLSASKAQQVFDQVTESQILLISDSTFVEIYQTFIRPKFDKYVSLENLITYPPIITLINLFLQQNILI